MNRFMYFVLGALSGAVVGGLTGLLLTPYSGDQMRNRITDYVDLKNGESN
jgi:gas vesicle protein